ncbi:MAG: ROK family protein [bacterium]
MFKNYKSRRIALAFSVSFFIAFVFFIQLDALRSRVKDIGIGGNALCSVYEVELKKNKIILEKPVTPEVIINFAKSAFLKTETEQLPSEKIALSILKQGLVSVAKGIVKRVKNSEQKNVEVFLFGGVAQGGGDFYRDFLQVEVNNRLVLEKLKNIVTIKFSELGDERAIIGAVFAAKHELHDYDRNSQYAVGIDIGGTNIRAALVNLSTMKIEGQIYKEPVFTEDVDKQKMAELGKKIRLSFSQNQYRCMTSEYPVSFYLRKHDDQAELSKLKVCVLAKLQAIIEKINVKKSCFVAVALAGIVSSSRFVKCTYALPFTAVNLAQDLQKCVNLPAYLLNDLKAAGLGEFFCSLETRKEKFIVVGVGTGFRIVLVDPSKYAVANSNGLKNVVT